MPFNFGKRWLHLLHMSRGMENTAISDHQIAFICCLQNNTSSLCLCFSPLDKCRLTPALKYIGSPISTLTHPLYHLLLWNHTPGKFGLNLSWLKASDDHICSKCGGFLYVLVSFLKALPSRSLNSRFCMMYSSVLPSICPDRQLVWWVNHSERFNIYVTLVQLSSCFMWDCIFDKITDSLCAKAEVLPRSDCTSNVKKIWIGGLNVLLWCYICL